MKAIIKTPTPDIKRSLEFYQALEYVIINESSPTLISDGKVVIEIDPDRYARAGITFFKDSWKETIDLLNNTTSIIEKDSILITTDPSGVAVYMKESVELPVFQLPDNHVAIPGSFSGLSIESLHFESSLTFWEVFGYQINMGSKEDGWVAMTNDTDIGIGIMRYKICPHLFFNPSYTYFNGKENLKVIENIRKSGVDITEEITHFNKEGIVDNIIIRDPGGFGYFIFSD